MQSSHETKASVWKHSDEIFNPMKLFLIMWFQKLEHFTNDSITAIGSSSILYKIKLRLEFTGNFHNNVITYVQPEIRLHYWPITVREKD